MYNPSLHPQVRYSLEAMTKGLFFFLQSSPLEKITVSQICAQAGLTRRTFYRNCEKKEDLILYACDRLIEEQLSEVDFSSRDAEALYCHFFAFWEAHRQFLSAIFQYGFFKQFVDRYVGLCSERMHFPLQDSASEESRDTRLFRYFSDSFLLGGLSRMLYAWNEEDFCFSAKEMARTILFLVPVPDNISLASGNPAGTDRSPF